MRAAETTPPAAPPTQQISANAERLIASVRQRYPEARLAMVGTLARGADDGGGRRTEVDALLGTVAARHAIPFVGVGDWLTRHNLTRLMADGVHMNPRGTRPWPCCWPGGCDDFGLRARGIRAGGAHGKPLRAARPEHPVSRNPLARWARMAPITGADPCVR